MYLLSELLQNSFQQGWEIKFPIFQSIWAKEEHGSGEEDFELPPTVVRASPSAVGSLLNPWDSGSPYTEGGRSGEAPVRVSTSVKQTVRVAFFWKWRTSLWGLAHRRASKDSADILEWSPTDSPDIYSHRSLQVPGSPSPAPSPYVSKVGTKFPASWYLGSSLVTFSWDGSCFAVYRGVPGFPTGLEALDSVWISDFTQTAWPLVSLFRFLELRFTLPGYMIRRFGYIFKLCEPPPAGKSSMSASPINKLCTY